MFIGIREEVLGFDYGHWRFLDFHFYLGGVFMKINCIILLLIFLLPGCALRVGPAEGLRRSTGAYPPGHPVGRLMCIPCLEIADRYAVGFMWFHFWPVLWADLQ